MGTHWTGNEEAPALGSQTSVVNGQRVAIAPAWPQGHARPPAEGTPGYVGAHRRGKVRRG